jgi:hypothetical protein
MKLFTFTGAGILHGIDLKDPGIDLGHNRRFVVDSRPSHRPRFLESQPLVVTEASWRYATRVGNEILLTAPTRISDDKVLVFLSALPSAAGQKPSWKFNRATIPDGQVIFEVTFQHRVKLTITRQTALIEMVPGQELSLLDQTGTERRALCLLYSGDIASLVDPLDYEKSDDKAPAGLSSGSGLLG